METPMTRKPRRNAYAMANDSVEDPTPENYAKAIRRYLNDEQTEELIYNLMGIEFTDAVAAEPCVKEIRKWLDDEEVKNLLTLLTTLKPRSETKVPANRPE